MPFGIPKLTSTLSNSSLSTKTNSSGGHHNNHGHSSLGSNITNNLVHSGATHPFELSLDLESPPIVLYGPSTESTGSLLSGQLKINITEDSFLHQNQHSGSVTPAARPPIKRNASSSLSQTLSSTLSNLNLSPSNSHNTSPINSANNSSTNLMGLLTVKDHILINSVQLSLNQKISYAKPFLPPSSTLANCANCKKKVVELARWDIMSQSHNLPVGEHSYPFSHLLPGQLPATTTLGSSSLTSIRYELVAIASYNNHHNHQTLVKVVLPLNITRSILRGPDRNSLRVFPPTEVTATAVLPNVIYPRSSFALELKLDGVANNTKRWRMRRVGWRIEEHVRVKASSCSSHKTKLKVVEEHTRKSQQQHKLPPVKRNQQSGPTTQVIVSNTTQPEPALVPSQSNAGQTPNADADALHPSDSATDLTTAEPALHPSDHANQEIRQQQEAAEAERNKEAEWALYTEETRTIASGDLRNGWKSDFSGKGRIELVADISCFNLTSASGTHHTHVSSKKAIELPVNHPTVSCDIEDPILGISTGHILIVEVVIAEEVLQSASGSSLASSISHSDSIKNHKQTDQRLAEVSPAFANQIKPTSTEPAPSTNDSTSSAVVGVPTGSARVLRMQFKLIVTERSGLGIAWDDEVPPMYDDVSALSPPTYDDMSTPKGTEGTNPPLYPLNFAPAHTHTHLNGSVTPGVIFGIGDTPLITPRPSAQYQSIHGAMDHPDDSFTLN